MGIFEIVRVNVNHSIHRERIPVVQSMLDIESNLMTGPNRQIRVDTSRSCDGQPVALPSHPEICEITNSLDTSDCRVHLVHDLRLDSVEHAPRHSASRANQEPENSYADDKPRNRIDPGSAKCRSDGGHRYRQRCQRVRPGVLAIGDERLRPNRAADLYSISSHELVA